MKKNVGLVSVYIGGGKNHIFNAAKKEIDMKRKTSEACTFLFLSIAH